MINNSIFAQIPDARMRRLVAALELVNRELDFLISLKPVERIRLHSISDARLPYVLKCLEYCAVHRVKIGMAVEDFTELTITAKLHAQLRELLHLTDDLRVGMRDTEMMIGANLFRMCRSAHGMMRLAFRKGRPGMEAMLDDLNQLFVSQGRSQKSTQIPKPVDTKTIDSTEPGSDVA